MILYVRYNDGKCDYVNSLFIDALIRGREISMFYRPSEQQWVEVETGRVRRGGRDDYGGIERRKSAPLA